MNQVEKQELTIQAYEKLIADKLCRPLRLLKTIAYKYAARTAMWLLSYMYSMSVLLYFVFICFYNMFDRVYSASSVKSFLIKIKIYTFIAMV